MIYGGIRGHVVCFDENSGQEMWRTKLTTGGLFNAAWKEDVAILSKENVIIAGCNGHVWGLDPNTGQIQWHNDLSGLGNGFVALSDSTHSTQYIHVEVRKDFN